MLHIDKLSESNLYNVLCEIFPLQKDTIKRQAKFEDIHRYYKVDYSLKIDNQIIIFEFDGPRHFTNTKNQIRDLDLKNYCQRNNIILIRIPYFMQVDDRTLSFYMSDDKIFDSISIIDKEGKSIISSTYRNGFWDSKIVFPSDFNMYGWKLFYDLYKKLSEFEATSIAKEIYESLEDVSFDVSLGIDYKENSEKYIISEHYPT